MRESKLKKVPRSLLEMQDWLVPILFVFLSCVRLSVQIKEYPDCPFPGAPAHSHIEFSNETLSPGTVATYACERGFELLGPSRRVCDKTGQWLPEGIPFCVLNVAAGKAPMQVSSETGGIPQKAIDGSTSSFFNTETCTLTRPERVPWWYVNLLEPYMVQLVRLDFGKACCGKNKPATIIVRVGNNRPDLGTNPICNRFTGYIEEGKPLFLPCNPPMPGAFVSVHLETPAGNHQLSICEAFVYTDQALPIERCPQFRDQPPGSTATYNGKCYIFYNRRPMNLRDALAFCRSRGGSLVDESNPALQGFISWELWRRHRGEPNAQYWMGAIRDQNDRTNWKWLTGEDVTVSFWNLPGGNDDCARYDGSKGWLWSDTNCNAPVNFICGYSQRRFHPHQRHCQLPQ
uniref:Fucolectin-6 n=1 Tax=Cacopsylla melanoneura TaxID=428564 RepID=A0A8D8T4J1_9HEMI